MPWPAFRGRYRFVDASLACLLSLAVLHKPAWAQSDLRTWHAAVGSFSVEAELIDVREDKVQLKKRDGTTLWVDLEKLSLSDVKFVEASLKKARSSVAGNLKKGMASQKTKEAESSSKPDAGETEPATDPTMTDEGSDTADSGSKSGNGTARNPFAGMRDVQIVLGRVHPHEIVFPASLSPFVAVTLRDLGGVKCQIVNIRTGKKSEPFAIDPSSQHHALSSDGQVFASSGGFPAKIALYATGTGKLIKELQAPEITSISKLCILNAQQIIVFGHSMNSGGAIYDVKSGKLVKPLEVTGFFSKFALSPDGRLLAVPSASGNVSLLDTKTGKKKGDLAVVSDANKSSLPVSDLAFCNGGTELAIISSGLQTELQVFSLKTNRPRVKHVLSTRQHEMAPHAGSYLGPAIESLSQNKGWILYGRAIVDAKDGGPIWIDNSEQLGQMSNFRVLIDDHKQLALVGDYSSQRFEVLDLPWSDINQTRDLVAKGGTVEDAGLPQITLFTAETAVDVNANSVARLYSGNKIKPLSELGDRTEIPIDPSLGIASSVHFGSPQSGMLVVTTTKGVNQSNIYAMHMDSGKEPTKIPVGFATTVMDCSPSGQWMVSVTGKTHDRVDIFDLESAKHVVAFRPPAKNDAFTKVTSVKFLSDDRLLTVSGNGHATVWDPSSRRAVYSFRCFGQVAKFPGSGKFVHFSEHGGVIRNTEDGKAEGNLEPPSGIFGGIPTAIHIRSDESALVALMMNSDSQQIAVWDLLTGKLSDLFTLNTVPSNRNTYGSDIRSRSSTAASQGADPLDLGITDVSGIKWATEEQVLLKWSRQDNGRFAQPGSVSSVIYSLLSLKDHRLLWDYRLPPGMVFDDSSDGRIWFTGRAPASGSLISAVLPTEDSLDHIRKAPPAKRLLLAGESVAMDIEVSLSGDKLADGLIRDQLVEVVKQNLEKSGLKIADRSALKLNVRVLQVGGPSRLGNSNRAQLMATCQITDVSNEVLWRRNKIIEPVSNEDARPLTQDESRRKQWTTALAWIKTTVDPAETYEQWYYRGVGESILTATGERLLHLNAK